MASMYYLAAAALVAVVFAVLAFRAFRRRGRKSPMDEMDGGQFEQYCAGLLENEGFSEVHVTAASRDFGADILCQKDGVTYAVQCKRYEGPVGLHAVQEVYAARDYYGCMVGAVMCSQYFTEPAVKMAEKLNILLWDRDYLEEMAEEAAGS